MENNAEYPPSFRDGVSDTPSTRGQLNFVQKLSYLKPFLALILEEVAEPLCEEFLSKNPGFVLSYFPEAYKARATFSMRDFVSRFSDALLGEGEEHDALALVIATSFIHDHLALYQLLEGSFDNLAPSDFAQEGVLSSSASESFVAAAVGDYGHLYPYLLVVLLGIGICQDSFEKLKENAATEFRLFDTAASSRNPVIVDFSTPSKPPQTQPTNSPRITPRPSLDNIVTTAVARSLERFQNFTSPLGGGFAARSVPSFSLTDPLERSKSRLALSGPRGSRDLQAKILRPKAQQGYLLKKVFDPKKQSQNKAWVSRWVVIKEAAIYYFRAKDSLELLGKIPIHLVNSARRSPKYGKRTFSVSTVGRIFHFQAETEQEVNDWLFAIQCEIAFNLEDILSRDILEERKALEHKDKWWKKSLEADEEDTPESKPRNPLSKSAAITEVYSSHSNSAITFTAVVNSDQGHRATMEDEHSVIASISEALGIEQVFDGAFFGVFDGHGGLEAAKYAKGNLLKNIVFCHSTYPTLSDAIREGVLKTDRDFIEWACANEVFSGTTAIAAILQERKLTVLNVGDSRAVLARGGEAIALSNDHKPDRPDERARIESAGGVVQVNRELNMMRLHQINPRIIEEMNIPQRLAESVGYIDVSRIMGELATSRSLGDAEYKRAKQSEFWEKQFTADMVIADPEIVEITLGSEDDFMILACDGLWDVMTNQQAVDFVSAEFLRASSAEKIARRLVKEAIRLGSQDNVTVIIVFWKE